MGHNGDSRNRRSGGLGAMVWGALVGILVVEAILDIVLLPADEVLIPAEGIGDTIYVLVVVGGALATRPKGGRQIRSADRGVLGRGLRSHQMGAHSWIGLAAIWGATIGSALFDEWFAIHHPLLSILFLAPALVLTLIFGFVALVWTIGTLISAGRTRYVQSRQVGP